MSTDDLSILRSKINLTTNPDTLDFKDIEYIPVDYESIMELLINRLKARLPNRWSDFLESNFAMEILEAVAYEASLLGSLINRYVNEMYLPTAKTADGVYNIIKSIGYKPKGPIPARTLMKFYIESPHTSLIRIPSYLPVGSGFYTTAECRIEPGKTEAYTYAVAGELTIDKFPTTGNVRDKYTLRNSPVSYIEAVFVNGEPYKEREFLDDINDKKVYTVEYTNTYKASISFGDGTYGENPKEGLEMIVYYNVNNGQDTNTKAYSITSIGEKITDANGEEVDVKCINTQSASGGKNPETPDEVKRNAPAYFRTQYRAVIRQDFYDILNYLGYNKVTVLDNSIDKNIGIFGVKVAALNAKNEILEEAEKDEIINELDKRKIIATQFEVVKPRIVPVNLNLNLVINSSYIPEIVTAKVRKLLTQYLSLENRDFGDIVSAVDIYSLINSVDGVAYAENLKITENKTIYVKEDAEKDSTVIKLVDTGNFLTEGTYISVINNESENTTIGMISNINGDSYTLDRKIKSNINKGDNVYPFMKLTQDVTLDSKEIYIESQGNLGEVSNSIVVFADDMSKKEHIVMYRSFSGDNGEKFRLASAVGTNYKKGSLLYIKKKNPNPIISGKIGAGATTLEFKTTPRFTPGAVLIPRKNITYDIETRTMKRSFDVYDVLPMDVTISDVRRIYVNPTSPFVRDVDYQVNNNKTIVWLNPEAIAVNRQYYVDIVKVTSTNATSDVKYYVTSVKGYTATISPALGIDLDDGDIVEVECDSLNIGELEIADLGSITMNTTQAQN